MNDVFVVVTWSGEFGYARDSKAPRHSCGECVYFHADKMLKAEDQKDISVGSYITGTREPDWKGRNDRLIDVEIVQPETEFEDFVVVHWNPIRKIGNALPPESEHGVRNDLFFGVRSILTEGIESLHPGSMIRGRRIQDSKYPDRQAIADIEIYREDAP